LASQSSNKVTSRTAWFLGLAALVAGLDQLIKWAIIDSLEPFEIRPILGEILQLTLVFNDSAAFSLGFGATWVLAVTSSIAAIALLLNYRKLNSKTWVVLAGVLLGGILGNLIDRFAQAPGLGSGLVVDYIKIPFNFPIFNLADIAIVVTISLTVLRIFSGKTLTDRADDGRD
jgi:signal peptidase II